MTGIIIFGFYVVIAMIGCAIAVVLKEKLNGDDDFLFISTYSSIFWPLSIIVLAFGGIFWCVLFVIRKLFNIIERFIKGRKE